MKKIMLVVVVSLIIGAIGYGVYEASIPKSKKIRMEMSRVLKDKENGTYFALSQYKSLQGNLADAYNDENRPDDAIEILMRLIKENREPQYNIYGQQMPRYSFNYSFESFYYKSLARSFEIKGDLSARDKALRKSIDAETIASKMRTRENVREKKEKDKERASILNR